MKWQGCETWDSGHPKIADLVQVRIPLIPEEMGQGARLGSPVRNQLLKASQAQNEPSSLAACSLMRASELLGGAFCICLGALCMRAHGVWPIPDLISAWGTGWQWEGCRSTGILLPCFKNSIQKPDPVCSRIEEFSCPSLEVLGTGWENPFSSSEGRFGGHLVGSPCWLQGWHL